MTQQVQRKKIAIVVSVPIVIHFFLLNHIRRMAEKYAVTVIANMREQSTLLDQLPVNVVRRDICIHREISPLADIKALTQLFLFFS